MTNEAIFASLRSGLAALALNQALAEPLMAYLTLLAKWNKTYNLTSIRELPRMVTHHLLDSLAILPDIQGTTLADIGTGAGLPGIPLAIACPHLSISLIESNGKKAAFMAEAKRVLGLKNIDIVQRRVEDYQPNNYFDTITSRAFSNLSQFIQLTTHLIAHNGRWLAMKGQYPASELDKIKLPYQVNSYTVPGLIGERCSVIINNVKKD